LLWVSTVSACLALRHDIHGWLEDVVQTLRALWTPDRLSQLCMAFVVFTLGLGLLAALAPPIKWDALVYHLTLPKLYAQTHGVRLDGDFLFSGMPQLAEMLYTTATLLRGASAAQTLGWAFGAVLALGLAAHATELLGARFAALAPATLFASFTIAVSLSWAYVDVLLMLFTLGVLIALRHWAATREWRWLLLGGVLSGFAVGCKYTGVVVPLAGLAMLLLALRHAPAPRHLVVAGISFLGVACLFASPWFLKNLIFTGSPTYPLLFPAQYIDSLRLWFYNRPDLVERNPLWAALIFPRAVVLGVQGGNAYESTLSPLLLFLPLALMLGWRRLETQTRGALSPVLVFTLAGYLGWVIFTFTSRLAVQSRLFFSIFPALVLVCAGGLAAVEKLDGPSLRVSFVVRAALGLVLGLSLFEQVQEFVAHDPLSYLTGRQTGVQFRAANLGWYAAAMDRVNALPDPSRVAFLWEARSLECGAPERCDPDVIIDRWWHLRRAVGTAGDILARWRTQGITHVLIYDVGADFVRAQPDQPFDPADWAELDVLRGQMHLIENIGGVYSLYTLR
jgi:4-amino-4-deoxy-L-arabinose transferase-like glycosyltransferase